MEVKITYFEKPGRENTETTLRLARERADALSIHHVVVASTYGETALKAIDVFVGLKVVIVGIATGLREHDATKGIVQPFPHETRLIVEEKGGVVLNSTHVFDGLTRALRNQLDWKASPISLISATLRIFGTGMKVACEISMMAADAGLVNTNEDAVVVAGSGRGADTALILQPVNANRFFDLKVKEIICKPRL